jgi:[ribosomal protein S18]-alanine N-acetyltransferase
MTATPMRPPQLVAMTPAHIEQLMEFEREMFGADAWTPESYQAELDDTELRHYLVALAPDGALLGWAGTMLMYETAQLLTIGVVPAAQRQGVARALLHALLEHARDRGATECILEVREDNVAARAFYAGEGFTRLRVRRGYYDNGRTNALELRLDLLRKRAAR